MLIYHQSPAPGLGEEKIEHQTSSARIDAFNKEKKGTQNLKYTKIKIKKQYTQSKAAAQDRTGKLENLCLIILLEANMNMPK